MNERIGLLITGHDKDATCVACNKEKECLHVEGEMIQGWICFNHLKSFVRMHLANRTRPDRAAPQFEPSNGAARLHADA